MNATPLTLAPSTGAKSSNLAFALGALPPDRKRDALVFYDFCRTVDDIADDPELRADDKRRLLEAWKSAIKNTSALPRAVHELLERRRLGPELFLEIIRGVEMDINPVRFATFAELQEYCWRVACAVGLVSIDIFGCRQAESRRYAEHLGYALQMTNILRDVGEDARMGRIYLPLEDLERFHVPEASLLAGRPGGDFAGLMAFECARARAFFAQARNDLHWADASALTPAEAMRAIYETLLSRMERDGFRVFDKRYRLRAIEKLFLLTITRIRTSRAFARQRSGARH